MSSRIPLDLEIHRSEVFSFIGPNDAGGTTTTRLLTVLVRPDRGSATNLRLDARHGCLAVKRRVGCLPVALAFSRSPELLILDGSSQHSP